MSIFFQALATEEVNRWCLGGDGWRCQWRERGVVSSLHHIFTGMEWFMWGELGERKRHCNSGTHEDEISLKMWVKKVTCLIRCVVVQLQLSECSKVVTVQKTFCTGECVSQWIHCPEKVLHGRTCVSMDSIVTCLLLFHWWFVAVTLIAHQWVSSSFKFIEKLSLCEEGLRFSCHCAPPVPLK